MQQIHTGVAQTLQKLPGSGGGRGSVGFAADVALQVQNRQIGVRQYGGHVQKRPGVIIAANGNAGIDDAVGYVQVACRLDMDGGFGILFRAGGRLGGFRGFLGGAHRLSLALSGTSETAGEKYNARRTQRQHHRCQSQRYF